MEEEAVVLLCASLSSPFSHPSPMHDGHAAHTQYAEGGAFALAFVAVSV